MGCAGVPPGRGTVESEAVVGADPGWCALAGPDHGGDARAYGRRRRHQIRELLPADAVNAGYGRIRLGPGRVACSRVAHVAVMVVSGVPVLWLTLVFEDFTSRDDGWLRCRSGARAYNNLPLCSIFRARSVIAARRT